MNVVTDASVVAKWLFHEPDFLIARRVLEGWTAGSLDLLAPDILAAETAACIWKRVVREGLPESQALELYARFSEYAPRLEPIAGLVEPALRLANQHRHPLYHCLYVALAAETGADLLTADTSLYRAFRPLTESVRLLSDWS
ncbi:MAG TPA: type II toxin-antitoxin system VapC family toxin [Terriglobia bacterium]|nr:type II toxin-antitoxin system VapC family toxin [Terriglobia bacterium]